LNAADGVGVLAGCPPQQRNPSIMKSIRSHLLAGLSAAAAFATIALAAGQNLPFRGTVECVENNTIVFPTLFVNLEGVGQATHLGRFRMSMQGTVDLVTRAGTNTAEFVAADGSRIFASVVGQATPTGEPDQLRIVEVFTIVSGTGRFAGVTGSFTLDRLSNRVTGLSAGPLNGTISPSTGNSP
jgi:hypothetical protein